MDITVNGEPRSVEEGTTITGLLALLALPPGPVAVERNGQVVPRAEHASAVIQPGDQIEVVHFVGGG